MLVRSKLFIAAEGMKISMGASSAGLYVLDFRWENYLSMKVSPGLMRVAAAPGVYKIDIVIVEGV